MTERWAPVRDFPDHYEISTLGRLRRLKPYRACQAGKIRKPQTTKKGYVVYMLSVSNQVTLKSAHRMVADAFIGPIPPGMEVNHKNGDKGDPRLDNLEIVSNSENRAHSYRVLKVPPNRGAIGLNNPNSKLTFAQVEEIRMKRARGEYSLMQLAREYNTTKNTIIRIVKMRTRVAA
jgi:hypothetical protein